MAESRDVTPLPFLLIAKFISFDSSIQALVANTCMHDPFHRRSLGFSMGAGMVSYIFVRRRSGWPVFIGLLRAQKCPRLPGPESETSSGVLETLAILAVLRADIFVADAHPSKRRFTQSARRREKVGFHLKPNPAANLVALGDLKDTKDSKSTRALISRGRTPTRRNL